MQMLSAANWRLLHTVKWSDLAWRSGALDLDSAVDADTLRALLHLSFVDARSFRRTSDEWREKWLVLYLLQCDAGGLVSGEAKALVNERLWYHRGVSDADLALLADMLEERGHPAASSGTLLWEVRARHLRRTAAHLA